MRGSFVNQVDGLIRQFAVGDVALGEGGGSDDRRVRDANTMVHFVAGFETTQDADGIFHGGLIHQDGLETAFQGGVFFNIFTVFVEGGGAYQMQFTPREHGLEHVAGVHGALCRAGTDDRVHLVDEQDDFTLGFGHLLEGGLEALLELTAILGPGHQGGHIQLDDALVVEAFGHIAIHNALGEALDDSRLADARLANQGGVVLGAAREDFNGTADFLIATDDRVQLALAGEGGQIAAVFFERLVSVFRVFTSDRLAAADVAEALQDGILGEAKLGQAFTFGGVGQAEQDMFGGGVIVAHAFGITLSRVEGVLGRAGKAGLGAGIRVNFGPGAELLLQVLNEHLRRAGNLRDERGDGALGLVEQREEQMGRFNYLVMQFTGQGLGCQDGLLGVLGIFGWFHKFLLDGDDLPSPPGMLIKIIYMIRRLCKRSVNLASDPRKKTP